MNDPRPAMISALPPESRSSVENCWKTRIGSSELSTLTALESRILLVRLAPAASTTAGAETAGPAGCRRRRRPAGTSSGSRPRRRFATQSRDDARRPGRGVQALPSMDLEVPAGGARRAWRELARGRAVPADGDIVEHVARRPRTGALDEGGCDAVNERLAGSLGIGSLRGRRGDEPPPPPTTRRSATARWQLTRGRGRERRHRAALAARRLVDFRGPHGWEHSATNLGRVTKLELAHPAHDERSAAASSRKVLPLVEAAAPTSMVARARGSRDSRPRRGRTSTSASLDVKFSPHIRSRSPRTSAVCRGWDGADIERGSAKASPHPPARRSARSADAMAPRAVAGAVERLLQSAASRGTYGVALGPAAARAVSRDRRARRLPAARPPARDPRGADRVGARRQGGVVVSLRGGDFLPRTGPGPRASSPSGLLAV